MLCTSQRKLIPIRGTHLTNNKRCVGRVVEACFDRLTRVINVELVAYDNEWSFSLLDLWTPVSKMGTSSRWYVNSIAYSNVKSSCLLAHGYRKGHERLSLPQIGTEWTLQLFCIYMKYTETEFEAFSYEALNKKCKRSSAFLFSSKIFSFIMTIM